MYKLFLTLILLVSAMTVMAAETPDVVLEKAIADGRVPGVVAMVASRDKVLYSKALGFAGVAEQVPMRLDSVFRIASMTKALTSVAVMQLVEQGKVELDAPMSRYLDNFEPRRVLLDVKNGAPVYSDEAYTPTVRQLLSHSSGFGYSVWNDRLYSMTDFANFSPTYFKGESLVFEPGTQWHYGTSTDWLGLIVEAVSGDSLEDYFARAITSPLGMADTAYNIAEAQQQRLVTRHQRGEDGVLTELPNGDFVPVTFFSGGAGLHATAMDYVRFMQMILNGGQRGARLLSEASVQEMSRNQIGDIEVGPMVTSMPAFSNDFELFPNSISRFGLGFLINESGIPGRRRSGSLTWGGLHNTYFWIDPQSGMCAVLMTQVLPFYDSAVAELLEDFEVAVYRAFAN